jgi:hypothetical protein
MRPNPQPKSHHFVPQLLLRQFTDNEGRLHCYDQKRPQRGIFSDDPDNVFFEGHLHSRKNEDGTHDPSLETNFFCAIESAAAPVITDIISAARSGRKNSFSPQEMEAWNTFYYHQWVRVPDTFRNTLTDEAMEQLVQEFIEEYKTIYGPLTQTDLDKFNDPKWRERLKHNAKVDALAIPGGKTQSILNKNGICVAVIRNKKKSFVIGSKPIVKLTLPGHTHIMDPSVEAWLPVAHDIAISPAPVGKNVAVPVTISDDNVRALNQYVTAQSSMIGGRSRALIASLVNIRK